MCERTTVNQGNNDGSQMTTSELVQKAREYVEKNGTALEKGVLHSERAEEDKPNGYNPVT
ncbi:MAG: hypothetical protein WA152_04125 [Microgenomates group bacterium]